MHTLAVPWERQERGCKSQLCEYVLPALIQNDADWNTEDKKQKNTFKNNVGFFLVFFLLLHLIQILFAQLESLDLNSKPIIERFVESYKEMWTLNGQNLSRVFSGSRALEGKNKVKKNGKTVYLQVKQDVLFSVTCTHNSCLM